MKTLTGYTKAMFSDAFPMQFGLTVIFYTVFSVVVTLIGISTDHFVLRLALGSIGEACFVSAFLFGKLRARQRQVTGVRSWYYYGFDAAMLLLVTVINSACHFNFFAAWWFYVAVIGVAVVLYAAAYNQQMR